MGTLQSRVNELEPARTSGQQEGNTRHAWWPEPHEEELVLSKLASW